MTTIIRPEISKKNKYWISKHRHYELKHFCLQYPLWKEAYSDLSEYGVTISNFNREIRSAKVNDPTTRIVLTKAYYSERIKMVEDAAKKADRFLAKYILKAVTEGHSYVYLKTRLGIPCSRDVYYEAYRRFFWLLDKER